jgi:hypothetical protein
MEDSETKADDIAFDDGKEHDNASQLGDRLKGGFILWLRRFVTFISFGPGILGFLWLVGLILKR